MDDRERLATRYHEELVDGIKVLTREIGYRAPYFAQMLNRYGGVDTTRRLLVGPATHEGFLILYRHQRLQHSVEAWMLHPEFDELFTPDERDIARRRLRAHGFDVDNHLRELAQRRAAER